jgi:hypothetical protein
MALVERKKTSLTRGELVIALRDGYHLAFGKAPSMKTLGVAVAQNALETAWGAATWHYNFGNITASKAWKEQNDYFVLRVQERLDKVNHPDQWTVVDLAFRAYNSGKEGAKGYWGLLGSKYYASVLPLFAAGDTDAAAHRLSDLGYFTAHVEDQIDKRGNRVPGYASNMAAFYKIFMQEIEPNLPPSTEPGTQPICKSPDESGDTMRCLLTEDEVAEVKQEVLASLMQMARDIDFGHPDFGKGTGGGEPNA